MNNSSSSILDSAKQGNVEAIARVFNKQLNSKGITVKVSAKNTHLNILFEHATSLPKVKAVEFTKKIITNIGILKFKEIRIYGKISDDEMPEWAAKIALDSSDQPSIRELAKNRDQNSLEALLSGLFEKEKISVKSNIKDNVLRVMLEAIEIPQKQALIKPLSTFLVDLKIRGIEIVNVFGKEKGEDFPEWHEILNLKEIVAQYPNDRKQARVLQELEKLKLSNKIYAKIQDICYDNLLCKIDSEVEKSVKEIAQDFIDNLEEDLNSDLLILANDLQRELKSIRINVLESDIGNCFTEAKEAHSTKIRLAIRELERLTEEILGLDIPEDSSILKSFFTNISHGVAYELTGESITQVRNEAVIGATIGSMLAPGLGTVVGGAIGSYFGGSQQKQVVQVALEKYEKTRKKVLIEWENIIQDGYFNLTTFLQSEYELDLLSYQDIDDSVNKYNEGIEILDSQEDDLENSLDCFNAAIKLNPGLALAWNNKGFVLNQVRRYVEAIQALDKALEIDEFMEIALINKGDAYKELDELKKALEIYNKGISKHPNSYYLWFGKWECLFQLDLYGDALEAAEQLLEIDSQDFNAWYKKAVSLVKLGKSEKALEFLSKAVEIDPDSTHKLIKDSKEFNHFIDDERFQELMESSVGISYLNLKKLLKSNKWEEADKETAKVIGDVVEKVTGNRKISEKSLEEFPLTDLNTLDSIWMNLSGGKFGFSRQKNIFQQCSKDKDVFGTKVGWRIADEKERYFWIKNSDMKYPLEEMPEGYLPTCLWAGDDGWFSNRRDHLLNIFQKLDELGISDNDSDIQYLEQEEQKKTDAIETQETSLIMKKEVSMNDDEAIILLDSAIDRFPENIDLYYLRAKRYRNKGKHSESLDDCKNVILLNSSYLEAIFLSAGIYLYQRKYKTAIRYFTAFIYELENNPNYEWKNGDNRWKDGDKKTALIEAYQGRSSAYIEVKSFEKSLSDLNSVAKLNPPPEILQDVLELIELISRMEKKN